MLRFCSKKLNYCAKSSLQCKILLILHEIRTHDYLQTLYPQVQLNKTSYFLIVHSALDLSIIPRINLLKLNFKNNSNLLLQSALSNVISFSIFMA